ncbi:MAG: MlaD family protein [Bacteroidota bacterium]
MRLSKEVKIGLFITTTLVVFYMGFSFLKGRTIFKHDPTYYTIYEDVKGLSTGGSVLLNGLQVGKVRTLDILPSQNYGIRVTFTIDKGKNVKLTDATVAKLVNNSLIGGKAIELSVKEGNSLQNGDTILGQVEQDLEKILAAHSLPILQDVKDITVLTNQFMTQLVENSGQINAVCTNLVMAVQELRQAVTTNQTALNTIGRNLAEASSAFADNEIGWRPLLARLHQLTGEVENMKMKNMATKLDNILDRLADGTLYNDLNQSLADLDKLLVDIRTNPSRYVSLSLFGRNTVDKNPKDK